MKNYDVYRIGKCAKCGQQTRENLGEFEAEIKEEAISKAQKAWSFGNFGQGGALRENDIAEEESFLNAEFIAEEKNE